VRVLLDECVPKKLKYELPGHDVRTVAEMGWSGLKNTPLLFRATQEFDTFVTVDQGPKHQQNLSSLTLGIVIMVPTSHDIDAFRPLMPQLLVELQRTLPGDVVRVRL
jgi:hypothetical protein